MVLYPIIQSVARRFGQGDQYEAMITDDEPIVLPRGASEVGVKTRQVPTITRSLSLLMLVFFGHVLPIILIILTVNQVTGVRRMFYDQ